MPKMRLFNPPGAEEGQSLVIVALLAVVLFAFVGLAIDGGALYSNRRIVQNAVDGASVRGAMTITSNDWRVGITMQQRNNRVLDVVNDVVESHGIPDTDGSPGNTVNGNVEAYYTDRFGQDIITADCPNVRNCTVRPPFPENPAIWGVRVEAVMPFRPYFAPIIGWNEMRVAASAISAVRPGERNEENNDRWGVFALNGQSCPGNAMEVHGTGGTNQIVGNFHSNGGIALSQTTFAPSGFQYQATHLTGCTNCGPYVQQLEETVELELPNFADYYNMADSVTQTGRGRRYTNPSGPGQTHSMTVVNGRNTLVWRASYGPLGRLGNNVYSETPLTFIDGDLVISDTVTTQIELRGVIVVNGNVIVNAPKVKSGSTGASIYAVGSILINPINTQFLITKAYRDTTNTHGLPLLGSQHVSALYSNQQVADVCNVPVIDLRGSGFSVLGAVIAPTGQVSFNNVGPNKLVNGTVIADTIRGVGTNIRFQYSPGYFPPQPNRLQLLR